MGGRMFRTVETIRLLRTWFWRAILLFFLSLLPAMGVIVIHSFPCDDGIVSESPNLTLCASVWQGRIYFSREKFSSAQFSTPETRFGIYSQPEHLGQGPLTVSYSLLPVRTKNGLNAFDGVQFEVQWAGANIGSDISASDNYHFASFPAVYLAPVFAGVAWIAWRKLASLRAGNRRSSGLCPACGYDIRASPERCPECGAVMATVAGDGPTQGVE
jgi:hypothetical protein